jgi:hypothetical protein
MEHNNVVVTIDHDLFIMKYAIIYDSTNIFELMIKTRSKVVWYSAIGLEFHEDILSAGVVNALSGRVGKKMKCDKTMFDLIDIPVRFNSLVVASLLRLDKKDLSMKMKLYVSNESLLINPFNLNNFIASVKADNFREVFKRFEFNISDAIECIVDNRRYDLLQILLNDLDSTKSTNIKFDLLRIASSFEMTKNFPWPATDMFLKLKNKENTSVSSSDIIFNEIAKAKNSFLAIYVQHKISKSKDISKDISKDKL